MALWPTLSAPDLEGQAARCRDVSTGSEVDGFRLGNMAATRRSQGSGTYAEVLHREVADYLRRPPIGNKMSGVTITEDQYQ